MITVLYTSFPAIQLTRHWQIWADEVTCTFKLYGGGDHDEIDCFDLMNDNDDTGDKGCQPKSVKGDDGGDGVVLAPRMPGMNPDDIGLNATDYNEEGEEEAVDDTWMQ